LSGYANRYEKAPQSGFYVNPQYTLDFVFEVLADERNNIRIADSSLPGAVSDATGLFTGYLLLDAWIGNTDRHHQNWGVIERNTPKGVRRTMAPTFDHASCLGREVPEEKKRERLATNDRGFTVEAYVQRCPFRFVRKEGTQETLHPRTVFRHAVTAKPSAAVSWKRKLETLSMGDVETLFERIPPERISEADVQFALRILHLNRHELLDP
jgi:hypothetical protein